MRELLHDLLEHTVFHHGQGFHAIETTNVVLRGVVFNRRHVVLRYSTREPEGLQRRLQGMGCTTPSKGRAAPGIGPLQS